MSIPPYSPAQWQAIDALGRAVDQALDTLNVGLTMGGKPTYLACDSWDALEWQYTALGPEKRRLAGELLQRLQDRLAGVGSLRHYGLGKLYPGELVPRWALGCFWRLDGEPLWQNAAWFAEDGLDHGHHWQDAATFMDELLRCLALPAGTGIPAFEPDAEHPHGFVLPLLTVEQGGQPVWTSCPWKGFPTPGEIRLLPGTAAMGLRIPLMDLPLPEDDFAIEVMPALSDPPIRPPQRVTLAPPNTIRLALTVEMRQGTLHVFLPPIASARSYVDLLTAIEATAESLDQPVVIEGYPPPHNQGIQGFQITPAPGVLEVSIHPAASWPDLVALHTALDAEAAACGLCCSKFAPDGRPLGTGGGAHITLGGHRPEMSPLLRRPDLLRSLVTYWQHHPSLSYLFAGQFIGPTSQAPRVDEAHHDVLYELEVAFLSLTPKRPVAPEIVDALLRPLLTDVTGNTHRTALCVDKLFPVGNPRSQLGLLEFRGFEMPPHTGLRLVQMLLVRALVAWFWQHPFTQPLKRWGPALRDRWRLPHVLAQDFQAVLTDLAAAGYAFEAEWFDGFWEHRLPRYGQVSLVDNPARFLELRAALEPWPVLGDADDSGASRPVDNSRERLQVRLVGAVGSPPEAESLSTRYTVLCNGHVVPMRSTGVPGEYVGGVRFRARSRPNSPPPLAKRHTPLTFDVIDTWQNKWVGGAVYHADDPDGVPYAPTVISPEEAQRRFAERFQPRRRGAMPAQVPPLVLHPETPYTLDLRLMP